MGVSFINKKKAPGGTRGLKLEENLGMASLFSQIQTLMNLR